MHTIRPPPRGAANLSARIRPWPSASTMVTRFLPKSCQTQRLKNRMHALPRQRRPRWAGPPNIPSAVTSHPSRPRRRVTCRDERRKFAMVAQVTRPPAHSGGIPVPHRPTGGLLLPVPPRWGTFTRSAAFWFHAAANQLAANAAGTIPPLRKPK